MKAPAWLRITWLGLALAASGCGDGVGEPIKKESSSIGDTPGDYCDSVETWDEDAARDEAGMVEVLNAFRASGFGCGMPGNGASLAALVVAPELRCSARRHARDMADRGYFSELTPEGLTVEMRVGRAGYRSLAVGEVILSEAGAGFAALTTQFLRGGEECAELTDPRFLAVGAGKFAGLWAVDFAGSRAP